MCTHIHVCILIRTCTHVHVYVEILSLPRDSNITIYLSFLKKYDGWGGQLQDVLGNRQDARWFWNQHFVTELAAWPIDKAFTVSLLVCVSLQGIGKSCCADSSLYFSFNAIALIMPSIAVNTWIIPVGFLLEHPYPLLSLVVSSLSSSQQGHPFTPKPFVAFRIVQRKLQSSIEGATWSGTLVLFTSCIIAVP